MHNAPEELGEYMASVILLAFVVLFLTSGV
jgi:hypothetical protein